MEPASGHRALHQHRGRSACRAVRAGLCGLVLLCVWAGLAPAQTRRAPATGEPDWKLVVRRMWNLARGSADLPGSRRASRTGENAPSPESGQPEPAASQVAATDTGLLDIHIRDVDITALLEMLSYQARTNIVATTSVAGSVSANLYDMTLSEVLDAILVPNGYAYRRSATTIFVGTPDEIAAQGPPHETRVFKLRYISRAEAESAARAALGPSGEIAQAAAEDATRTSSEYMIVTDAPDRLAAVENLLKEIDVRPGQVLIEATILRATLNERNELGIDFSLLGGVDFQAVGSVSNAAQDLQTGLLPGPAFQGTTFNINTNVIGDIQGGFSFGIIKDQVAVFVRALEAITDTVVVANPKITSLNRQEGKIIVGRRDGYLTTTVTETAAIQTVEFLETGTQIVFTPYIIDDHTVRLVIHPKDSNGGLNSANLPFEETTEAQCDILINDGHTVLIGGMFRERTVSSKSQLPLAGDVPGLGMLFKSTADQTVREEVIVLLTVHILKETPKEAAQYAALLEDVERIRVGSRMGLLGIGRERLAQAYYEEALRQSEAQDLDRALMNVRMALHNQPKLLGALKLKERLLGKRLWTADGGRMRTFMFDLIERTDEVGDPPRDPAPFGRPGEGVIREPAAGAEPEGESPR